MKFLTGSTVTEDSRDGGDGFVEFEGDFACVDSFTSGASVSLVVMRRRGREELTAVARSLKSHV